MLKNVESTRNFTTDVCVKSNCYPKFYKAYTVPISLRNAVGTELTRMCDKNVIQPVRSSSWAAPIVCGKNGNIRICGNFKITINPAIEMDVYPLRIIDDILTSVRGNTYFCVLDLGKAYLQLSANEKSSELLMINTHMALFQFNRLPFGVATAPMIFQMVMDQITQGLEGIAVYLDDISIFWSLIERSTRVNSLTC